jgi:hypothetical protein
MGWRELAVAAAAAAAIDCVDEPLWLDGERAACDATLCADWFCEGCPFAHACDRTCGLCDASIPCADGGVRDCAGRCVADAAAARGDGCCEASRNCAAFAFDGGACEPPTVLEEAPAAGWCLLLTATICPPAAMTHTALRDAHQRRQDYAATLRSYAAFRRPVVVVENSGCALGVLRAAAPAAHFVSFADDEVDAGKGKGHAEHRAVKKALGALVRCTRILKVTGRYFVEDLDGVLDGLDAADVAVQSTPSAWTLGDGVLRSEVVGFRNNATLLDLLLGGQDESRGRPAERALFEGVRRVDQHGARVARFPALRVRPTENAERLAVVSEL